MKTDVVIIGAGPAGIFTAIEMLRLGSKKKIIIVEKGQPVEKRRCPKIKTGKCMNCKPYCHITTGFSGAGAFSDGKLSLSVSVGGDLPSLVGEDLAQETINYTDKIYLEFGADEHIEGLGHEEEKKEIRRNAIKAGLRLVDCPIRHLGTEKAQDLYGRIEKYLLDNGVEIYFGYECTNLKFDGDVCVGAYITNGKENLEIDADHVVVATGRRGADWLEKLCAEHNIAHKPGTVDIGVRVEVRDEVMEFLNKNLYEAKLVYYTPTFDDKVRTFCTNPSGEVATEYYENGLAVVNGHAYKSKEYKTNNTNFAILVSKNFTKPFKTPIEYGKHIAQLSNMLCDGKILVQTFGDFQRGRRTTEERLCRNNIIPTLKDAVPGDLSLVLPHRIMVDIKEMLKALDKVTPGIASDETLLYGVEVKFYSNKVVVDKDFETNIHGLRAIGDGASVTRGLQQASANGLSVARSILAKIDQK